jgi:hypothetical protein
VWTLNGHGHTNCLVSGHAKQYNVTFSKKRSHK